MRLAVVAAIAALAAVPAAAQQAAQEVPPELLALKQYVNSPDYIATTARIALEGDRDLAPECKTAKTEARVGFVVMRKPVFAEGNPHPVAGMWKDQIKVDRCGKPVIHNVLVIAQANGVPQIGLAMPGETALSPRLQGMVLPDVLKAGAAALKCKDVAKAVISDTALNKVIEQPKADAKGVVVGGKWLETWTVRACAKTTPVAVEFSSDGQGGAKHKIVK